ncbi:DUF2726 domain-containing protein [Hymenobacter nivis]|nr:DUF2726 domain-containing protein [Hymenobacter nivis]
MTDREPVFQLVSKKAWPSLIDVFKNNDNYNFIANDPILRPLIDQHFIDELLSNSSMTNDPDYKYYLQQFLILHQGRNYLFKLSSQNFTKLIIKIIGIEQELARAYEYALLSPDELICQQIIEKFNNQKPKQIIHSQEEVLKVTENKNISTADSSISIFKSTQEYHFYKAVREVFQTFLVFPNVALSSIIDFNKIQDKLTNEEKNYFFKSLIDCVIIDTEDNYKPKRFIELDSKYHDTEAQKHKDAMKDRILAVAGQKLFRVRRTTYKENERDFTILIREILR